MTQGCVVARAHAPGGPLHCAVVKPPRCRGKLTAQEPLWLKPPEILSTTTCMYAASCSHLTCVAPQQARVAAMPMDRVAHVTAQRARRLHNRSECITNGLKRCEVASSLAWRCCA